MLTTGGWTIPTPLEIDVEVGTPQVVVDPTGRTTVAWSASDGTNTRVHASSRSLADGWSSPQPISAAGGNAWEQQLALDPSGDVLAVWSRDDGALNRAQSATLDGTGPVVDGISVPTSATGGVPVTVSVTGHDAWSSVAGVTWSFGDGTTAAGATVTHTWASPGAYTVAAALTDAVGNTATRSTTITVAAPPVITHIPVLSGFTFTPRTVQISGPRRKTRSKVTITITTKIGTRRLKPGTYKVTATATNAAGRSKPVSTKLRGTL